MQWTAVILKIGCQVTATDVIHFSPLVIKVLAGDTIYLYADNGSGSRGTVSNTFTRMTVLHFCV